MRWRRWPTSTLVEANSSSNADLFNAEQVATACSSRRGGGQVSNSGARSKLGGDGLRQVFRRQERRLFRLHRRRHLSGLSVDISQRRRGRRHDDSSNPNTGAFQGQQSWYPNPDLFGYGGGFSCTNSSGCMIGTGAGSSAYETETELPEGRRQDRRREARRSRRLGDRGSVHGSLGLQSDSFQGMERRGRNQPRVAVGRGHIQRERKLLRQQQRLPYGGLRARKTVKLSP